MRQADVLRIMVTAVLVIAALGAGYAIGHSRAAAPAVAGAQPQAPAPSRQQADPDFISTVMPSRRDVVEQLPVSGRLVVDPRRVEVVAVRTAGRVERMPVFDGQSVRRGQVLAELYSPDFRSAQQELLLAQRMREELEHAGDAELREDAQATERAAADKLRSLGADPTDIVQLRRGQTLERLRVHAPGDGVVTQLKAQSGGYLNAGDTLLSIIDDRKLWLQLEVYQPDYPRLRLGQRVRFEATALPGEPYEGRIASLASGVDPATHTLAVRCEVANPQGRLRPEMFVSGELEVGTLSAWIVPQTAVLHERDHDYVVIEDSAGRYRREPVEGHALDARDYAVTTGLDPAQRVVASGGVLINAALDSP
jgi:Cu(I)/Ag(I) efflux system membrane fusion protein